MSGLIQPSRLHGKYARSPRGMSTGKKFQSGDSNLFDTDRAMIFRRRRRLESTTKNAARALAVCAFVILGTTGLILQLMSWNRTPGAQESPFYTEIPGVDLRQVPPARLPA